MASMYYTAQLDLQVMEICLVCLLIINVQEQRTVNVSPTLIRTMPTVPWTEIVYVSPIPNTCSADQKRSSDTISPFRYITTALLMITWMTYILRTKKGMAIQFHHFATLQQHC